jgi:ribosomal-protein-alanine N-acetyltransferase
MKIETERLILEPFSIELIDAAMIKDYQRIESLGYKVSDEWPEDDLMEALPFFHNLIAENGINGFNSWIILRKELREIIGSAGFIGNPDPKGNVEIGFGIIPSRRKQGYCREAVNALINWAMNDSKVSCIKAQCEKSNQASKTVLAKLGFKEIKAEEGLIDWEL